MSQNVGEVALDIVVGKNEVSGANGVLSKLGGVASGVGKAVGAGLAVAGAGIVAIGQQAISAYGEYEQLVGGVETLFKDNADAVIANADRAFKTAGMSANAYMQTVTSFSASLLQSLGGDTVKASEYADMAITDMADNANKMGTSMEMVQNAYQGFAKQNYTMLDNLKLGYGGTKGEMERLLEDASAIAGIEFDISSYADVVEAIHVIQENMGITGTTAKEASQTIQGSISAMGASWQNLLTGLTDPTQDFDKLITNFVESVGTVAQNLIPRLTNVLSGVTNLVAQLAPVIVAELPKMIETILPPLLEGAISVMSAIIGALPSLIEMLVGMLPTLIPLLIDGLVNMIVMLCTNFATIIQPIIDNLPEIIMSIVDGLLSNLPQLIQGVLSVILGVVAALPTLVEEVVNALPTIVGMVSEALVTNLPLLLDAVIQIMMAIITELPTVVNILVEALPAILQAVWDAITQYFSALPEYYGQLWEGIKEIFGAALETIKQIWLTIAEWWDTNIIQPIAEFFADLWQGICDGVSAAWEWICEVFEPVGTWIYDNVIEPVADFFVGLWEGIVEAYHTVIDPWIEIFTKIANIVDEEIIQPVKQFFTDLWEDIKDVFSAAGNWFNETVVQPITEWFSGMWSGLSQGASDAWEGVKEAFGAVSDWFEEVFSKAWQKVKDVFSTGGEVFEGIKEGIEKTFKNVVNAIIRGINKVITVPFDTINWVLKKIKGIEILGIKPFDWVSTFDVPQIPELAQGGVLEKGQVGLLEGKGGEAVIPLERNTGWLNRIADILNQKIGLGSFATAIKSAVSAPALNNVKAGTSFTERDDSKLDRLIELLEKFINRENGDMTVPIYIGNELVDEYIVNKNSRQKIRSGGHA